MKIYYKTLLLLMLATFSSIAQVKEANQNKTDSLQQKTILSLKEKFPATRILNLEYGQSLSRKYTDKLFKQKYSFGEIKSQETFTVTANIPLFKKRKWLVTGSVNYQFNAFELQQTNAITNNTVSKTLDFHYVSSALSTTYFSALFKKPIIYNASFIVDGNDKKMERIKGLLGFSFILKRTANTTISLGAIVFIDPTSQIPFFPTFSYNHKFKNSSWEIDFILPQRLLLRRFIGENGRFSMGTNFGATGFYAKINALNFADTYQYSQLELKTGILYEHRINNFIIGSIQGGLQNFLSNRLTEKGKPNKDYTYENKQDATGYFKVGFSIDPFAKKK
ncbi:MAG: hypothetical protein ACPG6B_06780 [Oceanihabitans sp.]